MGLDYKFSTGYHIGMSHKNRCRTAIIAVVSMCKDQGLPYKLVERCNSAQKS